MEKKQQRISVLFMFYSILFCVCLITVPDYGKRA